MCELLVGLAGVSVVGVQAGEDGRLSVFVETVLDGPVGCGSCGGRARVKDRSWVELVDAPSFGRPVSLWWRKRRFVCLDRDCPAGSWTEQRPDIAAAGCGTTRRAGLWATVQVGRKARPVSAVASELGAGWSQVMSAVRTYGSPLVDDPERVGQVEVFGVDETSFLAATRTQPTRWVSAAVDLGHRRVIDLFEGRAETDLSGWLDRQPDTWVARITTAVCDLANSYRASIRAKLPAATLVADPFHVVAKANEALDKVRRRVQNETLGHRGRKDDPLYRARKLLTLAEERLDDDARSKLRGLLKAGDPHCEVYDAWNAKEALRLVYTLPGEPDLARRWLHGLIDDCATSPITELNTLARTLRSWRNEILAWHTSQASNGPAEALNLQIKKVKRVGHGFTNLDNYRLRVLLHTGGCNWNNLGLAA